MIGVRNPMGQWYTQRPTIPEIEFNVNGNGLQNVKSPILVQINDVPRRFQLYFEVVSTYNSCNIWTEITQSMPTASWAILMKILARS